LRKVRKTGFSKQTPNVFTSSWPAVLKNGGEQRSGSILNYGNGVPYVVRSDFVSTAKGLGQNIIISGLNKRPEAHSLAELWPAQK